MLFLCGVQELLASVQNLNCDVDYVVARVDDEIDFIVPALDEVVYYPKLLYVVVIIRTELAKNL